MKRIYILLLACMGAMGVMAQGQKLKSRIIDKDYYPVDSANVTVKGTNISTTTDKNGNFVLENVPLVLDSIEVQKGKKDYSAGIPVKIRMRKAIMDRFAWFVKAGVDFDAHVDDIQFKDGLGFHVGGGCDIKMSRHWAFQPGLYLTYRKMEGTGGNVWHSEEVNSVTYHETYRKYELGYFEVPLLFALKLPVGYTSNLQIQFGGYFDVGLWGNVDREWTGSFYNNGNDGSHETISVRNVSENVFGNRLTGGAICGIGLEMGHYLIGTSGRFGWSSWDYGVAFIGISVEIGYKF